MQESDKLKELIQSLLIYGFEMRDGCYSIHRSYYLDLLKYLESGNESLLRLEPLFTK